MFNSPSNYFDLKIIRNNSNIFEKMGFIKGKSMRYLMILRILYFFGLKVDKSLSYVILLIKKFLFKKDKIREYVMIAMISHALLI